MIVTKSGGSYGKQKKRKVKSCKRFFHLCDLLYHIFQTDISQDMMTPFQLRKESDDRHD